MDSFRKCLEKDFSTIYVFNLRGNQRTSGELSRREGGKIFGSGSRTPIAITLLVKKTKADETPATIYYHDIGDYLSREDKLAILRKFGSIEHIEWQQLSPNKHGDWLNQRNDAFENFIPLAPEKKFDLSTKSVFTTYSLGLATGRDAWVYNFSKKQSMLTVEKMIHFYNEQVSSFHLAKNKSENISIDSYINLDPTKFSWNRNQKEDLQKGKMHKYYPENFTIGFYRPFCKNNLYFDKDFNAMLYMNKRLFPYPEAENKVICLSGIGASKDFSALITDAIPDLQVMFNGQCFPMYHYEERKIESKTLFDDAEDTIQNNYIRRDAISDFILERCRKAYGPYVGKEDIFYYVYGILHSTEYRTSFAADLKKMLPRIPLVDEARDFWSFSKAGRTLAELHLNYENRPSATGVIVTYNTIPQSEIEKAMQSGEIETINYQVEKMRFPSKTDKSKIIYNSQITIENIPATAYEYVVNGKSAIEWIMERYAITTHKDSGITNNPNDWATEHNNPHYILDLLLSVISLSMETVEIVNGLPKLTF